MSYRTVFERAEQKYLLTPSQYEAVLREIAERMEPDEYGEQTVRNLYWDTPDFRIIRRSLEKPVYKEKLRLRCYARVGEGDTVFLELKKKYKGIVYKRRLPMTLRQSRDPSRFLAGKTEPIPRELSVALQKWREGAPRCYLCYLRSAFFDREDPDFRITFDRDLRYRFADLRLESDPSGERILPADRVLMELKAGGGIPLWAVRLLSREKIYPVSFSKYGEAYLARLSAARNAAERRGNTQTLLTK